MKILFRKKGQSILESSILIMVTLGTAALMFPIVKNGWNALLKQYEEEVHFSETDPFKTAPPGGTNTPNCRCAGWNPTTCGTQPLNAPTPLPNGECYKTERKWVDVCTGADCFERNPARCISDPECCTDWIADCTGASDVSCCGCHAGCEDDYGRGRRECGNPNGGNPILKFDCADGKEYDPFKKCIFRCGYDLSQPRNWSPSGYEAKTAYSRLCIPITHPNEIRTIVPNEPKYINRYTTDEPKKMPYHLRFTLVQACPTTAYTYGECFSGTDRCNVECVWPRFKSGNSCAPPCGNGNFWLPSECSAGSCRKSSYCNAGNCASGNWY